MELGFGTSSWSLSFPLLSHPPHASLSLSPQARAPYSLFLIFSPFAPHSCGDGSHGMAAQPATRSCAGNGAVAWRPNIAPTRAASGDMAFRRGL